VRHADGVVVVLRAVLERIGGTLWSQRTEIVEHPPGAAEVRALDDVFGNAASASRRAALVDPDVRARRMAKRVSTSTSTTARCTTP
jgi:hypothetical protein